jgi:hypothetical protein
MSGLADQVLPLVRTRAELWRWKAANAHGGQMHAAVDILEGAIGRLDPAEIYAVTHKALASALVVISKADDSSGIIGDACRRLLILHPKAAAAARVSPAKLVEWMIRFQFDGIVDFFELDPVAYAPALGAQGMTQYRQRLADVKLRIGPEPADMFAGDYRHEHFVLHWNEQRLAVFDRDIEAIIRTHARDRKVAAWIKDAAEAFEEIDEIDLAIDWAKQAAEFDRGHQAQHAANYWCALLEKHRPGDALAARLWVFQRWPSSSSAAGLYEAAGIEWPGLRDAVIQELSANPREAVVFALHHLREVALAWELAHTLQLTSSDVWSDLVKAYAKIDPHATLPVHRELVELELAEAGAHHYRRAAHRLRTMRKVASGSEYSAEVDAFVAQLRSTHRRRPRLQAEFDRAGL